VSDASSETEQPLIAHLLELRLRLMRILIGIAIAFAPLAYFGTEIYTLLAHPLMALMPSGTSMIATQVASPFFAPIKLAGILAAAVSMPWTLYQVWAFVAPGLYKSEQRLVVPLLASSTVLFYAGMAFAYFLVLPTVFGFLVAHTPEGVAYTTDINEYLNFVLAIFLAFGIAFETPVAIVLLVRTGFVTPAQLRAKREYVLVGVFVLAAVLTPPDVMSQLLLAIPSYILYEIGIVAAAWLTPGIKEVEAQQAAEKAAEKKAG
jgi:sec-independent protein translocase protein TatC